jgi:hypothetical protein
VIAVSGLEGGVAWGAVAALLFLFVGMSVGGLFLGSFCCLAGFSGVFGCGFAPEHHLNCFKYRRGRFPGFLLFRGGREGFGWFPPYSFLHITVIHDCGMRALED